MTVFSLFRDLICEKKVWIFYCVRDCLKIARLDRKGYFVNLRNALVIQALLRNNVPACRSALKAETVYRIRNDLIRLIPA